MMLRDGVEYGIPALTSPPICGCRVVVRTEVTDRGDVYLDITEWLGGESGSSLPVITKAENREGSCVFKVLAGGDSPAWTLSPGMYVAVYHVPMTPEQYAERGGTIPQTLVFSGYISTMEGHGTYYEVTCADVLAMLGRQGTWLRRNYRESGESGSTIVDAVMGADGKLSYDPSTIPGTVGSVKYYVSESPAPVPSSAWAQTSDTSDTEHISGAVTLTHGKDRYVREVTVGLKVGVERKSNVGPEAAVTYSGVISFGWDADDPVVDYFDVTFRPSESLTQYLTFKVRLHDSRGADSTLPLRVEAYIDGESREFDFWDPAVWMPELSIGCSDGTVGTVTLDTLDSSAPSVPEGERDGYDLSDRVYIVYTSGKMPVTDIMGSMLRAIGYSVTKASSLGSGELAYYRVGGGYALGYLQKLADVRDPNGRRLSYTGIAETVYLGQRASSGDESYQLKYGGDPATSGYRAVDFVSFTPSKTMKRRPSLVTMRATIEGCSVMCSLEDLESKASRGVSVESLSSEASVSDLSDLGQSAYDLLRSRELDQWEGTAVLAGVVPMMHESDNRHAGSGEQVMVKDSRHGIDDSLHVMQSVYDYNTWLTTLTLGSYSAVYSSSITDATAQIVELGQVTMDTSGSSLIQQQYLYLCDTYTSWSASSMADMVSLSVTGKTLALGVPVVYSMPDGTCMVLATGTATASSCVDASREYDVQKVIIDLGSKRMTLSVPELRRPDYHVGQTLTVCVRVRPA